MTRPHNARLAWLAALILLSSPFAHGHRGSSDLRTRNTLAAVRKALESFHRTYGVYPPQTNWMNELTAVGNPALNINRREKVFYEEKEIGQPIQDGWYNNLVYLLPGIHNPASFDLYSLGEDGKTRSNGDDPDDLAIWHSHERIQRHYHPRFWNTLAFRLTGLGFGFFFLAYVCKRLRRARERRPTAP